MEEFKEFQEFKKAKQNMFNYFGMEFSKEAMLSRIIDYTGFYWTFNKIEVAPITLHLWEEYYNGDLLENTLYSEEVAILKKGKEYTMAYDRDLNCYYILLNRQKRKKVAELKVEDDDDLDL